MNPPTTRPPPIPLIKTVLTPETLTLALARQQRFFERLTLSPPAPPQALTIPVPHVQEHRGSLAYRRAVGRQLRMAKASLRVITGARP